MPNMLGSSGASNGSGAQYGQGGIGEGFGGELGSVLGGIFGLTNNPYSQAMQQYQQYAQQGAQSQQPFYNAGVQGLGNYQQWLGGMQDPTKFINNTMNQYQESPYAKYMQQQSIRSGQNAASAGGLMGSTPFAQQLQQNASNISSGDMNQWLGNVMGVNTQYGQGQMGLANIGQGAANQLTNLYGQMGSNMGDLAGAKANSNNNSWMSILSGLFGM